MSVRIVCQSAEHRHGDSLVTEFYRGHGGRWCERSAYSHKVLQQHDYPLAPDISERDVMKVRTTILSRARKPRAKASTHKVPPRSRETLGTEAKYVFVCDQCGHDVQLREERVARLMALLDYAESAGVSLISLAVITP